MNDIKTDNGK